VYYRLVPEGEVILAKTHMPYALSPERMAKFRTWFLTAPYEVSALPTYAVEVSSNPFVAFYMRVPTSGSGGHGVLSEAVPTADSIVHLTAGTPGKN
jgi:hypothetical protein